jgi:hypothetical protein
VFTLQRVESRVLQHVQRAGSRPRPGETLTLPGLPAKITKSCVLTGGEATVKQTDTGLEISVPKSDRHEIDMGYRRQHRLVLAGNGPG